MKVMDATSLGIGALSLAIQVFNVASDGFSGLRQRGLPQTPLSDVVGLQVQQCRFISWAKATGLSDGRLSQLEDTFLQQTILNALCDVLQLLQDAVGPNNRYGLEFKEASPPTTELRRASQQAYTSHPPLIVPSDTVDPGMSITTQRPERAQALLLSARESFLVFQQARWTVSDRRLLRNLIQQLREKNDNLECLVPRPVRISAAEFCETVMLESEDAGHLKRVARAASGSLPSLAQSADFKSSYINTNTNRDAVNQAKYIHRTQLVLDITAGVSRTLAIYEAHEPAPIRVLVEWKRAGILKNVKSMEESERIIIDRIKRLAVILASPTDSSFRSLVCLGYTTSVDGRVGLVFNLPVDAAKTYSSVSLREYLNNPEKAKSKMPAFEDRLRLCHTIALSIYRLHRTGVIHKHITPANFIFFQQESNAIVSILNPFLTGFDFAREEDMVNQSEIPKDYIDEEEIYRHPSWESGGPSTKAVDIYALGILLIEISSWVPIRKAKKKAREDGITDFRAFLLAEFIESGFLAFRMGTAFQNAVKYCLQVSLANEGEENGNILGSFYGNVVQGLALFLS